MRNALVALLVLGGVALAAPHAAFGPVRPPLPAPQLVLTGTRDAKVELPAALVGHVTAVQLMFTRCTATCPIQGALFQKVQARLERAEPELQLLSVSIDPDGDTRAALAVWLARYGAKPERWTAAVPSTKDADALLDFLRGRAEGADRHTAQAYVFDRKGQLVYRSDSMPDAGALVEVMQQVARQR